MSARQNPPLGAETTVTQTPERYVYWRWWWTPNVSLTGAAVSQIVTAPAAK